MTLGTKEIAARLHLSHRYVTNTLSKLPDFPVPTVNISPRSRRWDSDAVDAWAAKPRRK